MRISWFSRRTSVGSHIDHLIYASYWRNKLRKFFCGPSVSTCHAPRKRFAARSSGTERESGMLYLGGHRCAVAAVFLLRCCYCSECFTFSVIIFNCINSCCWSICSVFALCWMLGSWTSGPLSVPGMCQARYVSGHACMHAKVERRASV